MQNYHNRIIYQEGLCCQCNDNKSYWQHLLCLTCTLAEQCGSNRQVKIDSSRKGTMPWNQSQTNQMVILSTVSSRP